jgi:hypothetical protein
LRLFSSTTWSHSTWRGESISCRLRRWFKSLTSWLTWPTRQRRLHTLSMWLRSFKAASCSMTATNRSCRQVAASLSQTMVNLASQVKVWSVERSFLTFLWTNWEWRLFSFMPSIGSFNSLCLKVRISVRPRNQSTSIISCSRSWRYLSMIGSKSSAMTS